MSKVNRKKEIVVFAHWQGLDHPFCMGVLIAEQLRGKEVFSFTYNQDWLMSGHAQLLDPELQLYSGPQYLKVGDKTNFGVFLDSLPDRWGRLLMRRREAAIARRENRPEHNLFETDYLLGVYDEHRMGGLRFKLDLDGDFLNNNREMASPPWSSIRTLEEISLRLEDDDLIDDPEYIQWLNMLIAPGSSIGGARPKASILDKDKHLWIAKFPSRTDQSDIGAWEMVTHELARAAGLNVAEAQARIFSTKHHTFLSKRFDRTSLGERIHFASAMTLLSRNDGQSHEDGVSYLELVDFICNNGARVNEDLEELWRRIVFSICVSNTDDHLRNHGFLLTETGWVLSPAYDLNPVETGTGLKLNITENDNALDLDLALEVIPFFRLSEKKAQEIIEKTKSAVSAWRDVAKKYGISKTEQALKSRAFQKGML